MNEPTILSEGKTKIIKEDPEDPNLVDIESKDDITAGDGTKHDLLEGKAAIATETTCNVFKFLKANGVKTHFVGRTGDRSFKALRCDMIPIECVARRLATGSYLKRRPEMAEGTFFNELVVEFFEKDDSMNDPLLVFDPIGNRLLRYIAKLPLSEGFIDEQPWPDWAPRVDVLVRMANDTRKVFSQLERPWHHQKVTLVDLKIEFGRLPDGTIVVADVIDNDSWRIWPSGDKAQMKDKQVYRDLANAEDPAALAKELGKIKENYAWVAEATRAFLTV